MSVHCSLAQVILLVCSVMLPFHMIRIKLLDEVFAISGISKVEVTVVSRSRRLRLITVTETLIIPGIAKTESNNCFIIHCFTGKQNNGKQFQRLCPSCLPASETVPSQFLSAFFCFPSLFVSAIFQLFARLKKRIDEP